jgi:hypothetical protein
MMCGRNENPNQVQQLVEESPWLAHIVGLWTCTIYNKKQASRGLTKIVDDVR